MKSAEINVGDVLYWNDDNRWQEGYGRGHRVVVIDKTVGHWYLDRAGTPHNHGSRVHNPYGTWTNHGIVVEVQDGVGATRKEIVALRMLRGQYAICNVIYERGLAARNQAATEEEARREGLRVEHEAAVARSTAALALAVQRGAVDLRDVFHGGTTVEVTPEFLEALLAAVPSNWTYES